MIANVRLDPTLQMPIIFPGEKQPTVCEAAMRAVVMSEETIETETEPTGDLEIEVAKIKKPTEKSNIIFYAIIAIVILIIWKS